jgi:hypothetical protein
MEREELVDRLKFYRKKTLERGEPDYQANWKQHWINYKMAERELKEHDEECIRSDWFFKHWIKKLEAPEHEVWWSKWRCTYCERISNVRKYRRDGDLILCSRRDCVGNAMDLHIIYAKEEEDWL